MLSRYIEASGMSSEWLAVAAVGVAVISYFLGCFNGAVVVSRYILRNDVRAHGSGNAGLTNFYRVFGGPLTLVVILSDVVKAILSVLFAVFIAEKISLELVSLAQYWAGAFCLLGHMYPCTFQFRGGKGILSGGAIVIMIGIGGGNPYSWCVPVVVWGGFLLLAVSTRYVSLGSCWPGLTLPIVSWFVYRDMLILWLSILMGGLILWKHRGNIVRLIKGTESKFTLHKKAAAGTAPEKGGETPEPAQDEPSTEGPKDMPAEELAVEAAKDAPEAAPGEPPAETGPEEPSAEASQGDRA